MLSMRLRLLSFTAICLGLLPGDARAHKVTAVSAVARIDTQGRTYQLEMAMGVEPSETVVQNEQLPPETAARNFAEQSIQVYFDDQIAKPGIEVTTVQPDKEAPPEMQRLSVITTLSGSLPPEAEHFMIRVAETTEISVVLLVIKDGKEARRLEVMLPGEFSRPQSLRPVIEGSPFDAAPASAPAPPVKAAGTEPPRSAGGTESGTPDSFLIRGLGFLQTSGWLVLCFGLCFLLANGSGRTLLGQAGIFLLGLLATFFWTTHSGGSDYPASLSPLARRLAPAGLLWLSVEVLFHPGMTRWRLPLIFGFSLMVGLVLGDSFRLLPSPPPHHLAFLGGILLGFLVFLAAGFFLARPWRHRPWFHSRFVTPLCLALAGFAIYHLALGA